MASSEWRVEITIRYSPLPIRVLLVRRSGSSATAGAAGRRVALLGGQVEKKRRLRPQHFLQCVARAHLFAIGCVALCGRDAADADRADELAVDDDGEPAF